MKGMDFIQTQIIAIVLMKTFDLSSFHVIEFRS